jgi:predicted CoA-substrate-specific enzyme activase
LRVFGGIDIGASAAKAALINRDGALAGWAVLRSGTDFAASAAKVFKLALEMAGLGARDAAAVFSCGYGRRNVDFAQQTRTEIACHAAGAYHCFPRALTILDIGGQDNKIIKLDAEGKRVSFKMNRKCAAGTGAFIEEMALRLRLPIEDLNDLARSAEEEVALGSYCTVFSATEVLEKIKAGRPVSGIVRGVFHSVVKRILEMDTLTDTVVLTGGVIEHNPFIAELVREHTDRPVEIPPHAQITGALGGALYALNEAS